MMGLSWLQERRLKVSRAVQVFIHDLSAAAAAAAAAVEEAAQEQLGKAHRGVL
jgi:hypothetical protein